MQNSTTASIDFLNGLIPAAVALIGVIIGLLIPEYFRRRSRIEAFSQSVFERRLKFYEDLYFRVKKMVETFDHLLEDPETPNDRKKQYWGNEILDLADFLDTNALLRNESITVHTSTMFIGIDDAFTANETTKEETRNKLYLDLALARKMIRDETGLSASDRHFSRLTRAKHDSEYIQAFHDLEKRAAKRRKTRSTDS